MDKWQGTGQSIEEAIEKGLKELKISKDEAEIKVIQEPSKGFFGFGKKMAEVQIKKWNFFDVKQRYSARTQQQRVQQRQHQPQLRFEQAGKQEAFVRMA